MIDLLIDTQNHLGMTKETFVPWDNRVLLMLSEDDTTFTQDCKDALIAVMPNVLLDMGVGGQDSGGGMSAFGGTAILILVSVALTTVKQIESQLLQSNYEGLLK